VAYILFYKLDIAMAPGMSNQGPEIAIQWLFIFRLTKRLEWAATLPRRGSLLLSWLQQNLPFPAF